MDGVVLVVGGWWSTMEETKNKTCELNDCVYMLCECTLGHEFFRDGRPTTSHLGAGDGVCNLEMYVHM